MDERGRSAGKVHDVRLVQDGPPIGSFGARCSDPGDAQSSSDLLQVLHLVDVVSPATVDRGQQGRALQRGEHLAPELLLAGLVGMLGVLGQQRLEVGALDGQPGHLGAHPGRVQPGQGGQQPVAVPFVGPGAGGAVLGHQLRDDLTEEAEGLLAQVVGEPEGLVDLGEPLGRVEVRVAHQAVVHREEEHRLPRLALAARLAAEPVVGAPRRVPLAAQHDQAAARHDLVVLGGHLARGHGDGLLLGAVPLVGVGGRVQAPGPQRRLGEVLDVAAEHDVHAPAGHVGRHRDRAEPAGLRDDVRLALLVLSTAHRKFVRGRHAAVPRVLVQAAKQHRRCRKYPSRSGQVSSGR